MVLTEDVAIPAYLGRVLERLAERGEGNADIARALGLTRYTVARYIATVMEITDTRSRAGLVGWAWSSGWMSVRSHEPRKLHSDGTVLRVGAGAA